MTITEAANTCAGFIASLDNGGTVKNLRLLDVDISDNDFAMAGAVAGKIVSDTAITDCHSSGTVSATTYAGGVCGYNNAGGIITACYSSCIVSGSNRVGGICGYNNSGGTVSACFWSIPADAEESEDIAVAGIGSGTGEAEKITEGDWTAAIDEMNNAISAEIGYEYIAGDDGLPVLSESAGSQS